MKTPEYTGIRFKHFIPGILWFFLILILICLPQSKVPDIEIWWIELIKPDKFIHAAMFGIQQLLLILPYKMNKAASDTIRRKVLFFGILVVLWGLTTELIQLQIPGRSFEWMDWLADSVGVILVVLYFFRKEKKNLPHH
jgi:hypothetical protein